MDRDKTNISVAISGSFNKHFDQVRQKISEFELEGIKVLAPKPSKPISSKHGFVMLESDRGTPEEIELNHLKAISQSDFLYVVNPKGYIGTSVAFEIGYAFSRNIPIYSLEKPKDCVLCFFIKPEKSIQAIKQSLKGGESENLPPGRAFTLSELQDYIHRMVIKRGFEKETLRDVLLLLLEEVGELARAIRGFTGLKISRERVDSHKDLKQELADCLIYLVDLANLADIKLEDALREKERMNSKRRWRSRKANDHTIP